MKKIKFIPTSPEAEQVVVPPKPAAHYIPDWYKKKKRFDGKNFPSAIRDGSFGIKSCVPFMDSMINGYIQETWCDIYIDYSKKSGNFVFKYSTFPEILSMRDNPSIDMGDAFYPVEMLWRSAWVPHMPKGYSVLITHPLNHVQLPFFVLSGIIDSDLFLKYDKGDIPFYIKEGFTGIIPAGTPMYQIIPIKRERWHSYKKGFDEKKQKIGMYKLHKNFYQSYKNNFHENKVFK